MTKFRLILVMVLLLAISSASASTQYRLASVDIEDVVRVSSVVDTRFMASNDNVISDLHLYSMPLDSGVGVLNITNQDYIISYTVTIKKTGIISRSFTENLKVYKNGYLVENKTDIKDISWYQLESLGPLHVDGGSVYGSNVSATILMLPTPEVTVSSSTSVKAIITITNVAELQRNAIKDDLNPLFSFMYWTLTLAYADTDGVLLSFLYVFSFTMDAIFWLIWLSISSTFSVFAYIEAAVVFYAGWRNNKIKGFIDNLVNWHLIILISILRAVKELFVIVYDFLKSIVPGVG